MLRTMLVTGAVPVLLSNRERLAEAARAMLPKLSVEGVICRWDCAPIPLRSALKESVESEVVTLTEPGRVPMAAGVKVIWRLQVVLGARVFPGLGQVPVAV